MKLLVTTLMFFFQQLLVAQTVYITVTANGFVRNKTIVSATLSKPLSNRYGYQVVNIKTKMAALVQQTNATTILFILPDLLQAADTATYILTERPSVKITNPVTVEKQATGLLIKVQGKKVLFYNTSVILPPDTLPAYYSRSGFIHPLYSPAGAIITDDFPAGHAHQHGVMMAWANTLFKGQPHDFWNQQQQTANVKHVSIEKIISGPVITLIQLRLQQYSNKFGGVLNESWTITVYPFDNYFLFDLQSVQQNTTADTLYINKYHYGSIAFRGSRQWNTADSFHYRYKWNILTDSGYDITNADGKRAAYVAASGLIDGKMSGVTVFSFPENYNYPQSVRVHPDMPYWGFAPAATQAFSINPKQFYTSGFRYFMYDGKPDTAILKQLNNDLVHAPGVRVMYKKIN